MEDAHAKTVEECLKHFQTNDEIGLTPEQVKNYQAKYGPNGEYSKMIIYNSVLFLLLLLIITAENLYQRKQRCTKNENTRELSCC